MSCKLLRILRPKSGIYVVNESTLVSDDDVKRWTAACARQIAEDVAPIYGRAPVKVAFLTDATHAPKGAWVVAVLDDSDQAGALGYHTEDAAGRVYARVFVAPCQQYDVAVSTTLSHEIVETYCDPDVNRLVDTGQGFSVPYEACDPVEGDSYLIDGVAVSDFVYPDWYRTRATAKPTHFCHDQYALAPGTLGPGGYMVRVFPDGTSDQVYGARAKRSYIAAKRHQLGRADRRITKETTP